MNHRHRHRHRHRHCLPNSAIVLLLIAIAGCNDSIGDGSVSFTNLPEDAPTNPRQQTVESQQPVSIAMENRLPTGVTSSPNDALEVDDPPDNTDPFASDPDVPQTPDTPVFGSAVADTAADTPSAAVDPQRELTPIERMLQQRAAAIARATGKAVPSTPELFDETPREIKLLVKDNSFRAEGPDGALRVSFDDLDLLKILNMAPVPTDAADHFPEWLKQLHGKKVRVRGFMYPTMREDGITKFRMARDNDICCFVKEPKIYDTMRVKMKEGTTTDYIMNLPFDVVGTFRINPLAEFGELYELWRIDEAVIIKKRR